jgi:hypothetical protein
MSEPLPDRTSPDALLDALRQAGAVIKNPKEIKCAFHQDDHASAGIYEDETGIWRFKCHAGSCGFGGDVYDVLARATGKPLDEVLKNTRKPAAPPAKPDKVWTVEEFQAHLNGSHEATFQYTNPDTRAMEMIIFRIRRPDGKTFLQGRPAPGGFILRAPEKPWPIYNRARIKAANPVVVVEGEKCVHRLHKVGIVATTSPGGAGKAKHTDWTPLAGKTVYLWPDNDEAGRKHMAEVAEILTPICAAVMLVAIDDLGVSPKDDVVNYLDRMGDASLDEQRLEIQNILADANPTGPGAELLDHVEDVISGKYKLIRFPWPALTNATHALLPGTVTVLCGEAGDSKSLILLQAMLHWHTQGILVALFEMEEDKIHHLTRAVVQATGNVHLSDTEWVAAHADEARVAFRDQVKAMGDFGSRMWAAPDEQLTLRQLTEWMEQRAAEGSRVLAIDPVSAAASTGKPWIEDLEFVLAAKRIMRQHGASLILVTHPRPGQKRQSLDDMHGGRAYARFTQTVMWITALYPAENKMVRTAAGPASYEVNRLIRLNKARNSWGKGIEVGCFFDGKTFKTSECGIITE